jgi:hypothetical protein
MYGDAADIGIDANMDGKLTEIDARLIAAAAEVVERKYPRLVGGIGLYYNNEGAGWPYVHIDVRGARARWRSSPRRGGAVDSLPAGSSFEHDSASLGAASAASGAAAPVPSAAPSTTAASPAPSPIVNESSPATRGAAPTSSAPATAPAQASVVTSSGAALVTPPAPTAASRRTPTAARRTTAPTRRRAVVVTPSAPPRVVTPPAGDRSTADPFSSAAKKFRPPRP